MAHSTTAVAERVARRVRRQNRDLYVEMAIDGAAGLFFTGFTYGTLLLALWMGGMTRGFRGVSWNTALLITGGALLLGLVLAWRRVDPFAGVGRMSDTQWTLTMLSQYSGGFMYVSPRHSAAGFLTVLMSGPSTLLGVLAAWKYRLPDDPLLLRQAAEVLIASERSVELDKITALPAALLLKRAGLVKTVPLDGKKQALTLTDKGTTVLQGKRRIVPPPPPPSED